jgi:hypothetical protein
MKPTPSLPRHSPGFIAALIVLGSAHAATLDIPGLQRALTNGAAPSALETLAAAVEADPDNTRLLYNHAVAAYASRRWEDALVSLDRVEAGRDRPLARRARFQRGNAEYQLGVEAQAANIDETVVRWKSALEQFQSVLKEAPDDADAKTNDAFVRRQLLKLLLTDARKAFDQAQTPGRNDAQRIPPLRSAFEKFSDAKETSPRNEEAAAGEEESRRQLAEALAREGMRKAEAPLSLRPNRREPRLPDVDTTQLEQGLSMLQESAELDPKNSDLKKAIEDAQRKLAGAKVRQAETYLAIEEQIPITKEKLALLRMGREEVDKALTEVPDHQEAKQVGEEIDRRMAQVHEDEGDRLDQQADFSGLEQQAMQLSQALDHYQQANELQQQANPGLEQKADRTEQRLAQALDQLADKLMQSPGQKESAEGKAARLEGAEQALNELQSLQPSERTSQRAEQVGRELDGLRQMLAEKGRQPGQMPGQQPGQQPMPQQFAGPPLDERPRIDAPGSRGQAPRNPGRNLRDY